MNRHSLLACSCLSIAIAGLAAVVGQGGDRDPVTTPPPESSAAPVAIGNSGFEAGLSAPWGTGQYAENRSTWWTSGDCQSTAEVDAQVRKSGAASLHVVNRSPRAPHVFGTTQQPVTIEPGRRYRISLWARAERLASDGAVSIVVDEDWRVRPIRLPRGTYDWTEFTGEFSLPETTAPLRILSEDAGEAWLDDVEIVPTGGEQSLEPTADSAAAPPASVSGKLEIKDDKGTVVETLTIAIDLKEQSFSGELRMDYTFPHPTGRLEIKGSGNLKGRYVGDARSGALRGSGTFTTSGSHSVDGKVTKRTGDLPIQVTGKLEGGKVKGLLTISGKPRPIVVDVK